MTTTSCAGGNGASVATLTHDQGGGRTLYAYATEPARRNRQEDEIHRRLYGDFGATRSPRTPYICVWRDTGPTGFTRDPGIRPPEIFLTCIFGTDDWEPPDSMLAHAEARMKRSEAVIRLLWRRDGDGWRIDRFEAEIRDPQAGIDFRSINVAQGLAAVALEPRAITFPETQYEPLTFDIGASLPFRRHRGEAAREPAARVAIRGVASPMPKWVMY